MDRAEDVPTRSSIVIKKECQVSIWSVLDVKQAIMTITDQFYSNISCTRVDNTSFQSTCPRITLVRAQTIPEIDNKFLDILNFSSVLISFSVQSET